MKKQKKQVKKNFEEFYFKGYYSGIGDFSSSRDHELENWFRGLFTYINKFYPLKKGEGKQLIEFGCATGAASQVLSSFGWGVTATDISRYAIKKSQKNFKNIKFLVHDMEKPFGKEKFDLAVAFDVIEHLAHPEVGIKNVYDLLKKNGTALFSTPNDYPHIYNDPTHINVKTPNEWKKILRSAGFKNIFIKQISILPFFYRWSWRLGLIFPYAVNFKYVSSPVILIARK